jgi:prevent-host-death family protein
MYFPAWPSELEQRMNWRMHDARSDLSKVVRDARNDGPQTISRHGQRIAVVLSAEDYDRLVSAKPSFVEHLLSGPAWDDELVNEINRRGKQPSRDIV